jgi:hypothetical protein
MDEHMAEEIGNQLACTGVLDSIEEDSDMNAFKLSGVNFGVS